MLTLTETSEEVVPLDEVLPLQERILETEETAWGYVVRQKTDRFDHETAFESAGRFLGLILVVCAYGQWFLPATLFGGDAVAMKGAMSFVFGASGVGIYWFATRGLKTDLEVDLTRRELRVVNRNSRGGRRLQLHIGMRDIESAFLRRIKEDDAPAYLMVRPRRGAAPIQLAMGCETELMELQQRLKSDIKPVSEKLEDRMARNVSFLSSRRAS
ncbi:MAG: hypothetical protein AAFQ79_14425 [Pseudomonadota bacterium]